jgi:hypothetical protein
VWRGAFFFGARVDFGTAEDAEEEASVVTALAWLVVEEFDAGWRRELKEDMNSIDAGDSPRRLLKCSAASCGGRVDAYARTCFRSSSGNGSSLES